MIRQFICNHIEETIMFIFFSAISCGFSWLNTNYKFKKERKIIALEERYIFLRNELEELRIILQNNNHVTRQSQKDKLSVAFYKYIDNVSKLPHKTDCFGLENDIKTIYNNIKDLDNEITASKISSDTLDKLNKTVEIINNTIIIIDKKNKHRKHKIV